jgi:hypothetical protein
VSGRYHLLALLVATAVFGLVLPYRPTPRQAGIGEVVATVAGGDDLLAGVTGQA